MKPIWSNTLRTFQYIGDYIVIQNIAKKLGYPFFLWNNIVYRTNPFQETGLTIQDLGN